MENNTKINFAFVDQNNIEMPQPTETVMSGKNYVNFGENNDFPAVLNDYYNQCTILQSCVNTTVDYATGAGFVDKDTEKIVVNKENMTLYELFQKLVIDYVIFGAYAINVLTDTYGKISELYYLDVQNIRLAEDGKDAYYSKKWGKYTKKASKYPIFDGEKKPNSIFYYKSPKSRTTYGLPLWSSALKDVKTQIEISNFHLNSILNNFCPSGIVSFCEGIPDVEIQNDIENKINEKFSGAKNASKLLLTWSDSAENAPKFQRMSEDGFGEKYMALSDKTMNNILASFRCSAQLVGISTQSTGFSDIEYSNSFVLFKKLVISNIQRDVEQGFAKLKYDVQPTLAETFVKFDNNNSENQNVL